MGGTSRERSTMQREAMGYPWAVAGSNPSPAAWWASDPSSWSTMGSDLFQIGPHGSHKGAVAPVRRPSQPSGTMARRKVGEGGGGSCGGGDAGSRLSRLRGGGHDADPVAAGECVTRRKARGLGGR